MPNGTDDNKKQSNGIDMDVFNESVGTAPPPQKLNSKKESTQNKPVPKGEQNGIDLDVLDQSLKKKDGTTDGGTPNTTSLTTDTKSLGQGSDGSTLPAAPTYKTTQTLKNDFSSYLQQNLSYLKDGSQGKVTPEAMQALTMQAINGDGGALKKVKDFIQDGINKSGKAYNPAPDWTESNTLAGSPQAIQQGKDIEANKPKELPLTSNQLIKKYALSSKIANLKKAGQEVNPISIADEFEKEWGEGDKEEDRQADLRKEIDAITAGDENTSVVGNYKYGTASGKQKIFVQNQDAEIVKQNKNYRLESDGLYALNEYENAEYADLKKQYDANPTEDLRNQLNDKLQSINDISDKSKKLYDKYPQVAQQQFNRLIKDDIAANKTILLPHFYTSDSDVDEAVKRQSEQHPDFATDFSKQIQGAKDDGFGSQGIVDAIRRGTVGVGRDIERWFMPRNERAAMDEASKYKASDLPTSFAASNFQPKIILGKDGKTFIEAKNDLSTTFNSGVNFIGEAAPGILEFAGLEELGAATKLGTALTKGAKLAAVLTGELAEATTGAIAGTEATGTAANLTNNFLTLGDKGKKIAQEVNKTVGLLGAQYGTSFIKNLDDAYYSDNPKTAQEIGMSKTKAHLYTLTSALAFKAMGISPNEIIQGSLRESVGKDIYQFLKESDISKITPEQLSKKMYATWKDKIPSILKASGIEAAKMGGVNVAQQAFKDAINKAFDPNAKTGTVQDYTDAFQSGAALGGVFGLLGNLRNYKNISPATGDILYSLGMNSDKYNYLVDKGVKEGTFTQDRADELKKVINSAAVSVSDAKDKLYNDGTPMKDIDKIKVSKNKFREAYLDNLEKEGGDKKKIEEQKKEIEKENEDILNSSPNKEVSVNINPETLELETIKPVENEEDKNPESENPETEKTKTKAPEGEEREGLLKQAADIVNTSTDIKGFSAAPLKEAAKNNPQEFESFLKNIAEQAHDEKSNPSTVDAYGKELVDISQKLFPKADILSPTKTNNNGKNEESGQENGSQKANEKDGKEGNEKNDVGDNPNSLQQGADTGNGAAPSIEEKKTDIEKRRQDELSKVQKVVEIKPVTTVKDGVMTVEHTHDTSESDAKIKEINDRYDKEIADLEKTDKDKTGETPPEQPVIPPTQIQKDASEENMPIGMRNSIIDKDRVHRGVEPFIKEARRRWADNWNEVIKNIRENNLNPRQFIQQTEDSIRKKEKPTFNDYQNAIWYFDRLNTLNEMKIAEDELDKAKTGNDEGALVAVNDRINDLQDRINQSDYVAEETGREQGRGFASRQMMANLDYQLVSWAKNIDRIYNGNTPEFIKNFTDKIEAEYKQKEQELKEHYEAEYKKAAEEAFAKASKGKEATKKVQNKTLADKLRKAADNFEKFGKAKGTEGAQGAGVGDIQKKIANAMRHIANGIENNEGIGKLINAAVEKFSGDNDKDEFKAHLTESLKNAGIETPQQMRTNYIQDITDLSKETSSTHLTKDMVAPLKKLISSYINDEGVKSLSELVSTVHNDIKEALPDVEERDIRDAFSGYGIKNDTEPKIKSELQKLSQQAKTISELQDLLKPQGKETPTQKISRENKLAAKYDDVSKYMKEMGIQADEPPTTEASKKQSAANYAKTRIKNIITNSAISILEAKRNLRNGIESMSPTELQILESERKKMSSQLSDINKIKNPEIVIKKSLGLFDDKIGEYKRLSKEYKDPLRNAGLSKEAKAENLEKSKAYDNRRNELERQKTLLTTEMNPKVSEQEKAVIKYNEQLQKKIDDYKKRIKEGNYEKEEKPLPDISKNTKSIFLEKRLKQLTNEYNKTKKVADLYNRTWYQNAASLAAATKRAFVLSRIGTLIRLGAAVTENSLFKPIETVSGTLVYGGTKLGFAKKLSQQGERYGINSLKELSMNWVGETAAWKSLGKSGQAWKDFISEAKNGYSELTLLYGEASHQVIPKELRDHWMSIEHGLGAVGRVHGAEKSVSKRMEFERAYVIRKEAMKRKGMDVNNPVTQASIGAMSYQDANRSILMEDNWLSNQYEKFINRLQTKNPSIEKSVLALTLQEMMPIVKIPTNIILNAGRATLGLPLAGGTIALKGITEMINGNSKYGISKLSPEQSDALLRNLRMGNIGMGLMLAGYFSPNLFGAGHYYQKGLAQPDGMDEGDVKFFGLKIPRYLADNPYFVCMKIGATLHDVFNYYTDEKDKSYIQSATHALLSAGGGAIKESPILGVPSEVVSAIEYGNSNFWYNQVKATVEPGILQETAKAQDAEDNWYDVYMGGKAIPRQVENTWDALKSGIPYLRQTLNEK